jgi:hypothetical protein
MMPVAVTAITPVLLKYGYQASQMGMMQLALAGSPYKEDEEINALSRQMREKMVPAEMLPVINAMMGVQMPHIQIQMPPMQMPFGLPVRFRPGFHACALAALAARLTRLVFAQGIPMPGFPGQPQQPPPPPPEAPAPSADAPASS